MTHETLFDPADHERLEPCDWDEGAARQSILDIVEDTELHFADGHWPVHPDEFDEPPPLGDLKSLYMGAAGVCWALSHLAGEGYARLSQDYSAIATGLVERYKSAPDTGEVCPSYLLGAAGVLIVAFRLRPSAALADEIASFVEANFEHPSNEPLWGAPGTLLAAALMNEWSDEPRWSSLAKRTADALFARWSLNDAFGCHLWTQQLYGSVRIFVGAGHGLAGNVFSLLRSPRPKDDPTGAEIVARAVGALSRFVEVVDGIANWPPTAVESHIASPRWRVQWCHGAPGIVTSLASVRPGVDPRLDTMLERAGELSWRAGPLRKGPGICHGTASSGFAFLALYARSGDPKWLGRARAFAMHAMRQVDERRRSFGRGWYTLWTGDLGTAVFLRQCIDAEAGIPSLDYL